VVHLGASLSVTNKFRVFPLVHSKASIHQNNTTCIRQPQGHVPALIFALWPGLTLHIFTPPEYTESPLPGSNSALKLAPPAFVFCNVKLRQPISGHCVKIPARPHLKAAYVEQGQADKGVVPH